MAQCNKRISFQRIGPLLGMFGVFPFMRLWGDASLRYFLKCQITSLFQLFLQLRLLPLFNWILAIYDEALVIDGELSGLCETYLVQRTSPISRRFLVIGLVYWTNQDLVPCLETCRYKPFAQVWYPTSLTASTLLAEFKAATKNLYPPFYPPQSSRF